MTPEPLPPFIYKACDLPALTRAEETGSYAGMPVDEADGFIHFSTAAQLPETLSKHFAGRDDIAVFAVSTDRLGPALRWEPSRGGALFPHLYGSLDAELILWSEPIQVAADGFCLLPERVR